MTGTIEFATETHGKIKRATLEITVTRADGTVEELGIVADTGDLDPAFLIADPAAYSPNPFAGFPGSLSAKPE